MHWLKNYKLGAILATLVIVMFLIVSNFFVNENYYNNVKFVNSFVIPSLFVFLTLMGLIYYKKQNKGKLSFKQGFTFCYLNQFIGGMLSLAFILFYMNLISPSTRDIFNYQLFDTLAKQQEKEVEESGVIELPGLTKEESEQQAQAVIANLKSKRDTLSENVLSITNGKFWAMVFAINLFYIFNSVFLSLFFKTPKKIEEF